MSGAIRAQLIISSEINLINFAMSDKRDSRPQVQFIDIDSNAQGQRVDNFLLRHLKGVPKSRIYRIVRKGEVRVNKSRVKPDYRLVLGDQLRIPPVRIAEAPANDFLIPHWVTEALGQPLFEDEVLMAVNKPSGLAVHGGSGLQFGVIEALRKMHPQYSYLELVHRLDRETSGCLLLAKQRDALNHLHQQFRRETGQRIEKAYVALLSGELDSPKTVSEPLAPFYDAEGRKRIGVDAEGKSAKSVFLPIERIGSFTLVRIQLHTGRMHQARVHAQAIGKPILGDGVYGDANINRLAHKIGVRHTLLHAESYGFIHPQSEQHLKVKAPWPKELLDVIKKLKASL